MSFHFSIVSVISYYYFFYIKDYYFLDAIKLSIFFKNLIFQYPNIFFIQILCFFFVVISILISNIKFMIGF